MTLIHWLRKLAGSQPDVAKPMREAAARRATRRHTQGADDVVRAAEGRVSVQIVRDLSDWHRSGRGTAD